MKQLKAKQLLYTLIGIYLAGLLLTLAFKNQDILWDARLCLKMVDNSERHITFNHFDHPHPQNLAADKQEFVTWWSPGQYALPMVIQKSLGIKLNIAIKLLTGLCLLVSALGLFKLYRILIQHRFPDHDKREYIASLALLFAMLQPLFWENVFLYDGGGVLLLAYCPWFIYGLLKVERLNAPNLTLLLIAAFVGFFLKATFSCFFMAALAYLFLAKAIDAEKPLLQQNIKNLLLRTLALVTTFMVYLLVLKLAFLNHNRSIADSAVGWRLQARVLAFPLVAPLFKLLALDEWNKTAYWLAGSPIVLGIYYLAYKNHRLGSLYKQLLCAFIAVVTAFFILMYAMDTDVSYELRHYTILTVLLIPAILMVSYDQHWARYLVALCVLVSLCNGIGVFKRTAWSHPSAADYTGLAFNYPTSLLKKIHALDSAGKNGRDIFYFKNTDPLLGLQVKNNRVLLEDCFVNFGFDNRLRYNKTVYFRQNPGEIYVVYPDAVFRQDSVRFLSKFEKYHGFDKVHSADGFSIYRGIADGK